MKCPYCNGKNMYLKRTSPVAQYGCKDCEREIKAMRDAGMDEATIRKGFNRHKANNKKWWQV